VAPRGNPDQVQLAILPFYYINPEGHPQHINIIDRTQHFSSPADKQTQRTQTKQWAKTRPAFYADRGNEWFDGRKMMYKINDNNK